MLLSALKTAVEMLAERTTTNALFLYACQEVVKKIEARDHKLVATTRETIAGDGNSLYTTTATRDNVTEVKYFPVEFSNPEGIILTERKHLDAPANPDVYERVTNYCWYGANSLQLNTAVSDGSIVLLVRGYPKTLLLTTDVEYEPMMMGVLAWLGKTMWGDTRANDWEKEFQAQLEAAVKVRMRRDSNINGDREVQ